MEAKSGLDTDFKNGAIKAEMQFQGQTDSNYEAVNPKMKFFHILVLLVFSGVQGASRHKISPQMKHRALEKIITAAKNQNYIRKHSSDNLKHFKQQRFRRQQHYHFYDMFLL